MSRGFIYILIPDSNKSAIKIGRTVNTDIRISQHKQEWPDLEFLCAFESLDHKNLEHHIHKVLERFRVGRRELYELSKSSVLDLIREIQVALFSVSDSDYTPGTLKERSILVRHSIFYALHKTEQTVSEVRV